MAKRRKAKKGCVVETKTFKGAKRHFLPGKEEGTFKPGKEQVSFKARVGPGCRKSSKDKHKISSHSKVFQNNSGKNGNLAKATKACRKGRKSKDFFFPSAGKLTDFNECIHDWFKEHNKLAK